MSVRLKLKVVPRASSTEVVGWFGPCLKVRVAVAPERGRANAALEAFLAETLNLPKGSVRIVAGAAATRKVAEIRDLTTKELLRRLPDRPPEDSRPKGR